MKLTRVFYRKATLLALSSLSIMAGATIAPSLPQMAKAFYDIPNIEFLTKLVLSLPAIFIAVFSPLVGIIIDKFGRKKLLLFSLVLYGVAGSSGLYATNLIEILIGRAFLGIAIAGVITTTVTLIGDYFKGEELNFFMGLRSASNGFGGVLFILAGGFLADMNWRFPFCIYLVALLVFFAVLYFIGGPEINAKSRKSRASSQSVSKVLVFTIYLICFVGVAAFFIIPIEIPFLLSHQMHLGGLYTGFAIAATLVAAAITSLNYKNIALYLRPIEIVFVIFLTMGAGFTIVSFANSFLFIVTGLLVTGIGIGLIIPNTAIWLLNIVPEESRGKFIGGLSTMVFLGQFFSPIFFHPLVEAMSLSHAFRISGAFLAFIAIGFLIASMVWRKGISR